MYGTRGQAPANAPGLVPMQMRSEHRRARDHLAIARIGHDMVDLTGQLIGEHRRVHLLERDARVSGG
jgi:hypothetical protein